MLFHCPQAHGEGQVCVGWVSEDLRSVEHHCGQVTFEDPGPVQDGLRLLVILQIYQSVGQAVGG